MARAASLLIAALLLAACDPAYSYTVWNDTEQPVIVETHHSTVSTVRVEPEEHAQVVYVFGDTAESSFYMEIFTANCEPLGRVDLPTGYGTVAVAADGLTYIDTTKELPPGSNPPLINRPKPAEAPTCSG